MLRFHPFAIPMVIAVGLLASGCSGHADTASSASAAPASSPSEAATISNASASPAITPSASPTIATQAVTYTDIHGMFGEKEITQLASLGVFGDASGQFNAAKPIMRREFVRWLFKANNAIWANEMNDLVHPAQGGDSAFKDVSTTDPDFQYIEGLQDAGISVGFPDKTFRPDQPITREQALAIKAVLDRGGVDKAYVVTKADSTDGYYNLPAWKDKQSISPEYVGAIATGVQDDKGAANESVNFVYNVERTFGAIAELKPKATLTRGQAAMMLWKIGPHARSTELKPARSAADALLPVVPSPSS